MEEENLYHSPTISPEKVYLAENFDDEAAFKKKWVKSEAKKQGVDENIAKYDGKWEVSYVKHLFLSSLLERNSDLNNISNNNSVATNLAVYRSKQYHNRRAVATNMMISTLHIEKKNIIKKVLSHFFPKNIS